MAILPSVRRFDAGSKLDADYLEGNAQGSVVVFEPSTSEHISARTIHDPITALAPATDCQTFGIGSVKVAIGPRNGVLTAW